MLSYEEWEKRNSLRSNDTFRIFREAQQRELQQERERMPFRVRRAKVLMALLVVQHEPAASIGSSAPSSASVHLPTIDEGFSYLEREECERLILALIKNDDITACRELEAALDAHRGFLRFTGDDIAADKDRRIVRDFSGWSPEEVVRTDRSLGPEEAVRRAREAGELDPETGLTK